MVAERAHIKQRMTNDIDVKSLPLTSLKGAEYDIWMSELSIFYKRVLNETSNNVGVKKMISFLGKEKRTCLDYKEWGN